MVVRYTFQLLEQLKVTGCYIFQLFRALEVTGRYIFQLHLTAVSFIEKRAHLCFYGTYFGRYGTLAFS